MIYLGIAVIIFLADYCLKNHVNETRLQGSSRSVLRGRVLLRNCHNENFALGWKPSDPEAVQAVRTFLLCGLTWEFIQNLFQRGKRLSKTALAFLLGGGWNNFYEQKRNGSVTDYVSFRTGKKKLDQIVWNLSDFFILAGAVLYAAAHLLPDKKNRK